MYGNNASGRPVSDTSLGTALNQDKTGTSTKPKKTNKKYLLPFCFPLAVRVVCYKSKSTRETRRNDVIKRPLKLHMQLSLS